MSQKLADQARPVVENLLTQEPDDLYLELGLRMQAMSVSPALAGTFAPELPETQGALDNVRKFGKEFFNRASLQAYGLLCGTDQQSAAQRQEVVAAFTNGSSGVATLLATLLVAQLGLAPAVAAVVAALVIKLFLQPAVESMCQAWEKGLPETGGSPAKPAS